MRIGIIFIIVLALDAKEKIDPRLKSAEKIFVSGNSRSANEVRRTLADLRNKTRWKNLCILSVSNKDEADAVLEIAETEVLGERSVGTTRLPTSAATLTLRSGDLIWSD